MFQLSKMLNLSDISAIMIPRERLDQLLALNEDSADYNLTLSEKEILELVQERSHILKKTERIEFGFETMETLIRSFYSSPYINQFDYVETLNELQGLFYGIKNEIGNSFSDEELILLMAELYNQVCHGSLELLKGRGVEYIIHAAKEHEKKQMEDEGLWK